MKRVVILSRLEFALLRSVYWQGGFVAEAGADSFARAALLREGMLRVMSGYDVLTERAFEFLKAASVLGETVVAELHD